MSVRGIVHSCLAEQAKIIDEELSLVIIMTKVAVNKKLTSAGTWCLKQWFAAASTLLTHRDLANIMYSEFIWSIAVLYPGARSKFRGAEWSRNSFWTNAADFNGGAVELLHHFYNETSEPVSVASMQTTILWLTIEECDISHWMKIWMSLQTMTNQASFSFLCTFDVIINSSKHKGRLYAD